MADKRQLLDGIGGTREGVLAGVSREGYPHLTNVLYVWYAGAGCDGLAKVVGQMLGRSEFRLGVGRPR